MIDIPSFADWAGYESNFDSREAFKNFFGKSNRQMMVEYHRNVSMRATDLAFMPAKPFRYYFFGLKEFLEKERLEDFDRGEAASSLFKVVEYKAEKDFDAIQPIMADVIPLLEKIAAEQEEYGLSFFSCGDYSGRLREIKMLLGV